jgi:hypothetical protein
MKTQVVLLALYVTSLVSTQPQPPSGPTLTDQPLSSDSIAIYREFLTSNPALALASTTLNVSLVTEPFLYKSYVDPDRSCLSLAHIHELSTPDLHKLPSEALADAHIHLVDLYIPPPPPPPPNRSVATKTLAIFHRPAAAPASPSRPDSLVTLSEIVFDDSHTHAAFRYTFASGAHNAKGATAIYELDHGSWKASPSTCSEWSR